MSRGRGRFGLRPVAVALAVSAVLLAGAHLLDEHRSYGEWSWSAPSPTPLLPFRERSYARQSTEVTLPTGLARIGVTWDDLPILGPPGLPPPTGVFVQIGPHAYVPYALKGGP